ncbi:hypothetical protein Tco_0218534 [Tanacetum coccineum]
MKQVESTDESKVSTEEIFEGTEDKVSTDEQMKGAEDQTKEEIADKASQTSTQTPTSMTFGDDETIATLLINMSKAKAASKEKEKGVELMTKELRQIECFAEKPSKSKKRSSIYNNNKLINKLNKKDSSKGEEIKQESKVEIKEEDEGEEKKIKRKPNEDKEVDYEILDKKFPIIDWKLKNLGTNHI